MATTIRRSLGTRRARAEDDAGLDPELELFFQSINRLRLITRDSLRDLSQDYSLSERGLHILGLVYVGLDQPGKLVKYLGVPPSSITFETDKLVAARLLIRLPNPTDRRGIRLSLTDQGRDVHRQAIKEVTDVLKPRFDAIPEGKREDFVRTLAKLAGRMPRTSSV